MFENLADLILEEIAMTDAESNLFSSVQSIPTFDYFKKNPKDYPESVDPKEQMLYDKASFLRLIQAVVQANQKPKHLHKEKCAQFVQAIKNSNTFRNLLDNIEDFPYVVLVETLVVIGPNTYSDDEATLLLSKLRGAPQHIKPLLCFPLLQWIGLSKAKPEIGTPKTLPKSAYDLFNDVILSPLILASNLSFEGSTAVNDCLRSFNVFDILQNKWMKSAITLFDKHAISICANEIFCLCLSFFKLYRKDISNQLLESCLLPLFATTLRKSPENFKIFNQYFNIFTQRHNICSFPTALSIAAAGCNSRENAYTIFVNLIDTEGNGEPKIKQYFGQLKCALSELVAPTISDASWNAFFLLQRLCKYLHAPNIRSFIKLFGRFSSSFDATEEEAENPNTFLSFLFDFFSNHNFSRFAIRAFASVSLVLPHQVRIFIDSMMLNNSLSQTKLIQIMDLDSRNTCSCAALASTLAAHHFTYSGFFRYNNLPAFVTFVVRKYFPDSVFKRYKTHERRWKALRMLVELARTLSLFDNEFTVTIWNDSSFTRSLISLILAASDVMQLPRSTSPETANSRFDRDRLRPVIEFVSTEMDYLALVIPKALEEKGKLPLLSTSFFEEGSDLFSTLVSFLELKHPLQAPLRAAAIRIIDLMCAVAARMRTISVDAFYPRERQYVLVESVRTNLFHATDVSQTTSMLDFISSTLNTQAAFAYSFVRRLGSAYINIAADKLEQIAKEHPRLLRSTALFLSQIYRKLSAESPAVTEVTKKANFWSSLIKIIQGPAKDADAVAAKAYFLRCLVCADQVVQRDLINEVIDEIVSTLPQPPKQLTTRFDINMRRFVQPARCREYGDSFYIDWRLLDRFLVGEDGAKELVEYTRQLNRDLTMIDACTQYLQALYALLRSRNDTKIVPELDKVMEIIAPILGNPLIPRSTACVAFDLLGYCLTCSVDGVFFGMRQSQTKALVLFITHRPFEEAFVSIATMLRFAFVKPLLLPHFRQLFLPCLRYACEHMSRNALLCTSEVALKLIENDMWIREYQTELEHATGILLGSELGADFVDLLSAICMNRPNAEFLMMCNYLTQFVTQPLPCSEDWSSPLWPSLFYLMKTLPDSVDTAFQFVGAHVGAAILFLKSTAFAPLQENELLNVQVAVTGLLARLAPRLKDLSMETPIVGDDFLEAVAALLKECVTNIRNNPSAPLSGDLEDRAGRSPRLNRLISLHNCLILFNELYEFPLGPGPTNIFDGQQTVSMISTMVDVIEFMSVFAVRDDCRPYAAVVARTAALALRVFCGRTVAIKQNMKTQYEEKEIGIKQKTNRGKVLKNAATITKSLREGANLPPNSLPMFHRVLESIDALSAFLAKL